MNPILHELRELESGSKQLRSFGLTVGGVLLAIGVFILWRRGGEPSAAVDILVVLGLPLMLLGAATPRVLRLPYRLWMGLALVLGFIMTRVLLTLMYFGVFTPIALIFRVTGRDPMSRRFEAAPSYWIPREQVDASPQRLEKYY